MAAAVNYIVKLSISLPWTIENGNCSRYIPILPTQELLRRFDSMVSVQVVNVHAICILSSRKLTHRAKLECIVSSDTKLAPAVTPRSLSW